MVIYIKKYLAIVLELCKVRITFFVAFTTAVGYILFKGTIDTGIILPTLGVFELACGASCINHFQEKKYDALMERTKGRPIPSGKIDATLALLLGINILLFGSLILLYGSNTQALILGLIAFGWYNLLYTPLKKKMAMAVVPGAMIGAIPPVIGWVSAGGNFSDPKILALALFFFIWQVPHFWLLLLIHGKDYEQAGFPTLTKMFSKMQIGRITYIWISALALSCIIIPLFKISSTPYLPIILIILAIILTWQTRKILTLYLEKKVLRKAFIFVNLFVLAVVVLVSLERLILV